MVILWNPPWDGGPILEVNTVSEIWQQNLASLCNITKQKYLSKNYKTNVTWKPVPGPF